MNTEFYEALDLLQKEKGIPKAYMFEKIKAAIASTIKRDRGIPTDNVEVAFDENKKSLRVYVKKTVVEEVTNKNTEISLEDAQQINTRAQIGDISEVDWDTLSVGRIAAKVGKNVIVQAINEAVNGSLIQEFENHKGSVVTGVVKRIENNHTVYLEIGKYELPLNEREQIPGERFADGEHVKVCVADIRKSVKSQEIILTRNSAEFIKCLFELEIPEIADGTVEITAIAREAGSRTKVAVYSANPDVDAVGSCIGAKQSRINSILHNLKGERIDLIKYSKEPEEFLVAALSPASVRLVEIDKEVKSCRVVVPTEQLSLAIGKTGQNVRLAARLTGYRIDIVSE